MIIKVKVDDKTYARMTEGKRVEGTIGYNEFTKEDRKSTRLNSSHVHGSRMPSSA